MTERERSAYLQEALFLNTVTYENQRVAAYILRMTGERGKPKKAHVSAAPKRPRH